MDLKIRRERIVSWVMELEDENLLRYLESLTTDPEGIHALSEAEDALLQEASNDVKAGNFSSNEDVQRRVKEWLYK